MELITEEDIRFEERWESILYIIGAGACWLGSLIVVIVNVEWPWYYEFFIVVGFIAYFVGYYKYYSVVYGFNMKDHPMRYSSNYRKTDGHLIAFMGSFIWPLLWLAKLIVRRVKQLFVRA